VNVQARLHPDDLAALAEAVVSAAATAAQPECEPLLDAKAAAALLSVPESWVRQEARAGRLPHVPLGRYVRFQRSELVRWWQARAQGPRR
jgi:excisionase family DNA binding protein